MSESLRGQIGDNAEHLITQMRDDKGNVAVGNVLRRTCQWAGENACKEACQLKAKYKNHPNNPDLYIDFEDRQGKCADQNLNHALESVDLLGDNILIVGVTANEVGFADKIKDYDVANKPDWYNLDNDENGWKELPGFNAFFAREGEVDALGRRLADCADINFEFEDSEGKTVIGFEHGTRTDMFGSKDYPFERNGEKVSFTEYALGQAIDHYGADPARIKIKLAAAIQGHNFRDKHFDSVQNMEKYLPGWYRDGYVNNLDNPDWQPDEDGVLNSEEEWSADTRTMIIDDIKSAMKKFGIPEANFNMEGIIDPAEEGSLHSSHENRDKFGDTRDLYMTYFSAEKN